MGKDLLLAVLKPQQRAPFYLVALGGILKIFVFAKVFGPPKGRAPDAKGTKEKVKQAGLAAVQACFVALAVLTAYSDVKLLTDIFSTDIIAWGRK